MNDSARLQEVLGATRTLLLDFDGPVCRIFASTSAADVTRRLLALIADKHADVALEGVKEDDPLSVLRALGPLENHGLLIQVEQELRHLEVVAVHTAAPTPFAAEAISSARRAGRTVAIVSNNSEGAIEAYLRQTSLDGDVALIVGRPFAAPERMKPHPLELAQTLTRLHTPPHDAVLLGDSVTDITAAHALGVRSVAFANKPEKLDRLQAAQPDALIVGPDAMAEVAAAYSELAP